MPKPKIGGAVDPSLKKVGCVQFGGLPFRMSAMLPSVIWSRYMPNPPFTTHLPLPVTSQATPTRGWKFQLSVLLSACDCTLVPPLAMRSWKLDPLPGIKGAAM